MSPTYKAKWRDQPLQEQCYRIHVIIQHYSVWTKKKKHSRTCFIFWPAGLAPLTFQQIGKLRSENIVTSLYGRQDTRNTSSQTIRQRLKRGSKQTPRLSVLIENKFQIFKLHQFTDQLHGTHLTHCSCNSYAYTVSNISDTNEKGLSDEMLTL